MTALGSLFLLYMEFHHSEVAERVTYLDRQTCNEVQLVIFELREQVAVKLSIELYKLRIKTENTIRAMP